MRALVVAFVVVAAGCTSDPCSGVSGTCISARVQGAVVDIDQLRVTLDGAAAPELSPSTPSSSFSLPVKLAIALPASATSPATLTVDALVAGQVVASTGPQSVPFSSGAHSSFTFNLGGVGADLAVGTDDGGVDMAPVIVPGHVTIYPTTLTFPSTVRGTMSAAQTVTIYNRTGKAVMTLPPDMNLGNGNGGGDFSPTGASPATCVIGANGVMIPADVDCQISVVFAPTASGMRSGTVPFYFDNGDTGSVSFNGVATPAWSAELVDTSAAAATIGLNAVWATNGVARAVGTNTVNGVAYLSTQPGVWNVDGNIGTNAFGVFGVGTTGAFASSVGSMYSAAMPGTWNLQTITPNDAGTPGNINGVWAASGTEAYAVTNAGQIYKYNGTSWSIFQQAPYPLYAISGIGPGQFVVSGAMGWISTTTLTAGLGSGTGLGLRGVWQASATNVFAVGDAPSSSMPGVIVHCTGATLSCMQEVSPLNGSLTAISGRIDPTTMQPDIWAVGMLGNEVLHSTGNGQWTAVKVPNNQAMKGVFVLPTGEVYTVGDQSQVNHYY